MTSPYIKVGILGISLCAKSYGHFYVRKLSQLYTFLLFFVNTRYLYDEKVPNAVYTQAVRHTEEDCHESGHQHAQRQEET